MIDLHSHILDGLDDGCPSLSHSLELARAAVAEGIAVVAATPHVRDDYPTAAEQMERRMDDLRAVLFAYGVPLEVVPGGELAFDWLGRLTPRELRRFALAGRRYLLVEFPYYGWPLGLEEAIGRLSALGLRVVLAHPERSPEIWHAPERLEPIVRAGALVQVTAASFGDRTGNGVRPAALALVELRLAHVVASDAHDPHRRPLALSAATAAVADASLARWLTLDVPAAILDGADIPPRPTELSLRWGSRARAGVR